MLNEAILPFPGTLLYTCFTVHVYTVFHYLASTPGGTHRKKTNGTAKEHLGRSVLAEMEKKRYKWYQFVVWYSICINFIKSYDSRQVTQ